MNIKRVFPLVIESEDKDHCIKLRDPPFKTEALFQELSSSKCSRE